jgi:hypothetical protein
LDFLVDVVKAAVMVGLPICLFTFLMVRWALQGEHFKESLSIDSLKEEMKLLSKAKDPESRIQNPIHRKWVKFGGGFYGIVAFFTYLVVEITEIVTMIIEFGGISDFIRQFNFNLIISIFVEAIINFVTAMVWPVYWLRKIDSEYIWVWFVAAYGGYWLGCKLAQQYSVAKKDGDANQT